jgi:hypothetical protein
MMLQYALSVALNGVFTMVQCSVEDQTASAKRSRRRWPSPSIAARRDSCAVTIR